MKRWIQIAKREHFVQVLAFVNTRQDADELYAAACRTRYAKKRSHRRALARFIARLF